MLCRDIDATALGTLQEDSDVDLGTRSHPTYLGWLTRPERHAAV